jgi:hypothetical protein
LPVTFKENQFGIWLEGLDELDNPQAVVIFSQAGRCHVQEVIAEDYSREVIAWNGNSLNVI